MLASGNSSVQACSFNLVNIAQREVPFSRSKGMNPDVYDIPFSSVQSYLDEAARDAIGTYEERVDVETVQLEFSDEGDGGEGRYRVAIIEGSLEELDDDDFEGDDE